MQSKKFLFERTDLNEQTSTLLFGKWQFGQVECSKASRNLMSQFNFSCKQPFDENISDSFYTPPVEKKPVPTPKAPVKYKKRPKKGDLKPKKLQYTEDELDASSTVDSGIHMQYDQSDNMLFRKQSISNCSRFDSSQKQIRRLRAKLDRINVQSNDKENDKNVIGNRSVNISNNRNNVVRESSVVFNPNVEVLSQYDNHFDWKKKLHWLMPRRDVGLWIECCRKGCKKWRYSDDYHDPTDVPKIWYCEMNSDKSIASCDIPERSKSLTVTSDLIENAYNAGSIVWAHVKGFPWWPAIINDCPDTLSYYELSTKSLKPIRYYVTFFYEELEYAWVNKKDLKPFAVYKYGELIKKTKYRGTDYKQSLEKAYETATNALSLTILERLKRYSFIAQYERLYNINNNLSQLLNNTTKMNFSSEVDINSDDEIPCSNSTKKHFSLKDYYLRVISNNHRV